MINVEKKSMTQEEVKDLEKELDELKTVRRKEIAEKIKVALSFGDLSENSEYDEAKNEQAFVEDSIMQIEAMLKNVELIDKDKLSTDSVDVGLKVLLLDEEFDEEVEYQIVGSTGADPSKGKISGESPLGKALIGKRVGETIEVEAPDGVVVFRVLEITK